jgi:hypothetical protein
MKTGDSVRGVQCPRCHEWSIVYNGNYWCESPGCEWVMSERRTPTNKAIIKSYLIQCWRKARMAGDQAEMDRLAAYLKDYADEDGLL